jgi:hypothetical protein
MDERSDRMTQPRGIGQARQPQAGLLPTRLDRAVSWSDFRTAVRYDPSNRMLLAVPAISAKRAEHPWLGDAVAVHTRTGDAEVYRREYEHGAVYWSERTGAHEVHGEIAARWRAVGAERSFLGLPTTDAQRMRVKRAASPTSRAGRSTGPRATVRPSCTAWCATSGRSSAGNGRRSACRSPMSSSTTRAR